MRAVGYIRVSRVGDRAETLISPELQRKAIEGLAEREGFEIATILEELDASGGDSNRPKWNEAIRMVERGDVQAIACWNLSRFSRSVVDALEAIERIHAVGGKLFSSAGDTGDDSASGRFTLRTFLNLAQFERERASEGFAASKRQAIEAGIFIGPTIPTGYSRDPKTRRLFPNELAPVVAAMFEMRSHGSSWKELAEYLMANGGSPTTSRQAVQNMLRNPSYLGLARQGPYVNAKAHQPIVSQRLFDLVATKQVPRKRTGRIAAMAYLSGIVRCDGCGYVMQTTSNGHGTDSYSCKRLQCTKRASARIRDVDEEVLGRIWSYLELRGTPEIEIPGNEAGDDTELADAQTRFDEAEYDYDLLASDREARRIAARAGKLDQHNAELEKLVDELEEARVALEMAQRIEAEPPRIETLRDVWDQWTHESQKEWLGSIIRSCTVRTANRLPIPASDRIALTLTITGQDVYIRSGGYTELVPYPPGSPGATGVGIRKKLGTPKTQELGRRAMEVHLSKRHGGFVAADVDSDVLAVARELTNPDILKSSGSKPKRRS